MSEKKPKQNSKHICTHCMHTSHISKHRYTQKCTHLCTHCHSTPRPSHSRVYHLLPHRDSLGAPNQPFLTLNCHFLLPRAPRPSEGAQGPFLPGPATAGRARGCHLPSQASSPLFPRSQEEAAMPEDLPARVFQAPLSPSQLSSGDELGGPCGRYLRNRIAAPQL